LFPMRVDVLNALLLGVPALFAIVNPIASALIFGQLLARRTHAERAAIAGRVGLYALIVLLVSFLVGSAILSFFGISLGALRLAGGLVVAHQGWVLLTARDPDPEADDDAPSFGASDAFYPLTVPITTGPGTISVCIALAAARPADFAASLGYIAGLTLAAALIAATVWICDRYVDVVTSWVGRSGASILMKLSAFILLCIGVQIMVDGVADLWPDR
jgi:multiple antibiotic resistance protein